MPPKIITYFLCALVLALSFSNSHLHLPKRFQEASYVEASSSNASGFCQMCWAQLNFQSDDGGVKPADFIAFPSEFARNLFFLTHFSHFGAFAKSPRAPPLA
jgi:hypothetical protein